MYFTSKETNENPSIDIEIDPTRLFDGENHTIREELDENTQNTSQHESRSGKYREKLINLFNNLSHSKDESV